MNLYEPGANKVPLAIGVRTCSVGRCSVGIFNSAGEQVRRLLEEPFKPAGIQLVEWDGRNAAGEPVASGVYLIRMEAVYSFHTAGVLVVR